VERAQETGAAEILIVNHTLDDAVRAHMQLPTTQPETRITRLCEHFGIAIDDWRFTSWCELAKGHTSPYAAYSYLHQLAQFRPVVLWFDDLEQSPQNIQAIDHILQNQDTLPSPILLLACVNSDALGSYTQCEEWIRAIEVHPDTSITLLRDLSAAEVESVIESLLTMDDTSRISILSRAHKDPSLAIFLVRDWVRRGWLELQKDRVFKLVADVSLAEATDATWDERVKDALATLNATERNCLLAGAILGQRVDQNEWRALCQLDGLTPHSILIPSMVDSGLVVWTDEGWVFTHPFVREAILRATSRNEVRRWHALAANLLGSRTDLQSVSRVATHLTHSAQPEVALSAQAYASDFAFRTGDLILAAQHAQTYMQLLQAFPDREAELLEAHVRYLGILRKRKGACSSDDFESMRTILARARTALYYNVEVDVLTEMSRYLTTHREWAEAERILQLAISIATRHKLPLYSPVARLADTYAYAGRNQESYDMYLKALDFVESEADIAWCHFGVGYVLSMQGQHVKAKEHLTEAYAIYEGLNDTIELNSVRNSIADIDRYEKRYDAALASYYTCLTQMENTGRVSPALHANITLVAMAKGDIDLGRIYATKLMRLVTPALFEKHFGMIALLMATVEEDWQNFDRLFSAMANGTETGWSDPDMAQGAEVAGILASTRGQAMRAFDALTFAARLWRVCNDPGRATLCELEAERALISQKT
jgi:tetratricopeptide (TPR) repeat protein